MPFPKFDNVAESDTEKEPNACNTSLFSNELPIANNFDSKCSEKATAENGSHKSDAKGKI